MRIPLQPGLGERSVGRRGVLASAFGAVLLTAPAHAFPQEHLKRARTALEAQDSEAVTEALKAAENAFEDADGVAPSEVLTEFWIYRGLLAQQQGSTERAMDAFRQALVVDIKHQWDTELSADRELRKVFEALRGEVEGRELIATGVPEATGCAVAYVDGNRVKAGQSVGIGRRLAQMQCPHGDVHGRWTTFASDEAVDWIGMCPYPVDINIKPVEQEPSEFEGLDIGFGTEETPTEDPCIELLATPPPVVEVSEEPQETGPEEAPSGPGFIARSIGKESWNTQRMVTVSAGGALIASGVILHYAVVVPAYDMVEWGRRNTIGVTRYQADILTDRFRTRRAIAYSMTTVGVLAATTGLVFMRAKPTSGLQPVVSPFGAGLSGRF